MSSVSNAPLNLNQLVKAHRKALSSNLFVDWLDYVLYRRQLGYPLSACRLNEAQKWLQLNIISRFKQRVRGHRYRQLGNLIDEYNYLSSQVLTPKPKVKPVDRNFVRLLRGQRGASLSKLTKQMDNKTIAIVGNSPSLIGKRLGKEIDKHDIVIRFNQCFSEHTLNKDIGSKLSLWVIAPDFRGDYQAPELATIIAGPAMLWKLQYWDYIKGCDLPVTDLPISVWRDTVSELNAPPSAGLLVLSWLKQQALVGNCSLFGFGFSGSGQYHQALPTHTPSERHDWGKERQIIEQWHQQKS